MLTETLNQTSGSETCHTQLHIRYDSVGGDEVTAHLLLPNAYRLRKEGDALLPAVIALHPTHEGGKEDIATPRGRANRQYGLELAQRGYVVLAPDTITAGERIDTKPYQTAAFYERNSGWTAVGKMLVDHMCGVDLLAGLEGVDEERIGAIGHSLGEAMAQVHELYSLLQASERFCYLMGNGGHDFPDYARSAAYAFLDKWLMPGQSPAHSTWEISDSRT